VSVPLLRIVDLTVEFPTSLGSARAVDRVSLEISKGEVLGVVGESGCGKSMTALAVLRLVPPPGRITGGRVLLDERDLLALPPVALQAVRGKRIAMIFQEPMTALNPVITVGEQIAEMIRLHLRLSRSSAKTRTIDLLRLVGIPSPDKRWAEYPHQLSGGMRQRVMIAMAISCDPDLVFADEPTTALDVTVQAQILDLLADLRERLGMAMVLISHNLGVIAQVAHRVVVMYAGRIVEETTTSRLFAAPQHPYTRGLLASLPPADLRPGRHRRLAAFPRLGRSPVGARSPRAVRSWSSAAPRTLHSSPPVPAIARGAGSPDPVRDRGRGSGIATSTPVR
jgi:ABC-type dipeptide/oligopeptide/nickel transport system ATPase component